MRSGYEKGYKVITLSDCVAATSAEEHENAIKFDYPMFSEVMTAEAFTEELQGAMARASAGLLSTQRPGGGDGQCDRRLHGLVDRARARHRRHRVAAAIVITIVLLARRIAGQARGAVEGVEVVRAQTDELAGIARINDSGVRILHSARALRKVAVGK